MWVNNPDDLNDASDAVDTARTQADTVVSRLDPEAAVHAVGLKTKYPWLAPSVAMGLGVLKHINPQAADQIDQTAQNLLTNAAQSGQLNKVGDWIDTSIQASAPRKNPGWFARTLGTAAGVLPGGDVLARKLGVDAPSPLPALASKGADLVGAAVDSNPVSRWVASSTPVREFSKELKGMSRVSTAVLDFPDQYIQGEYRVMTDALSKGDFVGALTAPYNPEVGFQTNAGSLAAAALSKASGEGEVDTGKGFFINPNSDVAQSAAEQARIFGEIRYADGSLHARTVGRDLANSLPGSYFEPGSTGFNFVSGLADAGVRLAVDQAAVNAPLEEMKAAAQFKSSVNPRELQALTEGRNPTTFERLLDSIGGIYSPTGRSVFDPDKFSQWATSKAGNRVMEHMADTSSISELDRLTGHRLSPGLLSQAAAADTPDAVKDAFTAALGTDAQASLGALPTKSRELLQFKAKEAIIPDSLQRLVERSPGTSVHLGDGRGIMTQLQREADLLRIGSDKLDPVLERLAQVDNLSNDMVKPYLRRAAIEQWDDAISGKIVDQLTSQGISQDAARRAEREMMTRYRQRLLDETNYMIDGATGAKGGDRNFFNVLVDDGNGGQVLNPQSTPVTLSQHASTYMPRPDTDELNKALGHLSGIYDTLPGVAWEKTRAMIDWVQNRVWKQLQTLKPATTVRVLGDTQATAKYTYGINGLFNHPVGALGWMLGDSKFADKLANIATVGRRELAETSEGEAALGRLAGRGNVDAAGKPFQLSEDFQNTMSKHSLYNAGDYHDIARGSVKYNRYDNEANWLHAAAVQLGQANQEPVLQLVARALGGQLETREGETAIQAAQRVFREDPWWKDYREALSTQHTSDGARILTDQGANDYIEKNIFPALKDLTGGNEDLLDAVRNGRLKTPDGKTIPLATLTENRVGPPDDLVGALRDHYKDSLPDFTHGPKWIAQDATTKNALERKVDWMRETIFSNPVDAMAKSPEFRQLSWRAVRENAAALDPQYADELIRNAKNAGLSRDDQRILGFLAKQAVPDGKQGLTLEQLTDLGHSTAADQMVRTMTDLADKRNFVKMVDTMAPFAHAWAESLFRWSKLLATDPRVVRDVERIHNAASDPTVGKMFGAPSYTDPATGQEVQRGLLFSDTHGNESFTYPMSSTFARMLGGPPVPLTGRAANLNIGFHGVPLVGPVFSLPLAGIMDHFDDPKYDGLRDALFPNGMPKGDNPLSQAANSVLPAWAKTAFNYNGGLDNRAWAETVGNTMNYLESTGKYDVHNPDENVRNAAMNKLRSDATSQARVLQLIRAAGQFSAPSSPSDDWYIDTPSAGKMSLYALKNELQTMRQSDPKNYVLNFLSKYGDNAMLSLVGATYQVAPGGEVPPTKEGDAWVRQHSDLKSKYGNVYGFFAPQNGNFDSNVYNQQISEGSREVRDPATLQASANSLVAHAKYAQVRNSDTGKKASKTPAGQAALAAYRDKLTEQFPGVRWDGSPVTGIKAPPNADEQIDQLKAAVQDPGLADNRVAQDVSTYLHVRDALRAASLKNYGKADSWTTRKESAGQRQRLFDMGTKMVSDNPDFQGVWEHALLREFQSGLNNDLTSKQGG